MATELDEVALAGRAQAGDDAAFRTLVLRHQDAVYSFLVRRLQSRDLAEDLAQETFVRACGALEGFRGDSGLRTWLIQIAVNLVRDRRRREARLPRVVSLEEVRRRTGRADAVADPEAEGDPLSRLGRREQVARLEQALGRLPEDYREAFLLKHVEGMSYQEMAELTGVSAGTLKVRAHRARRRLRELCGGSTLQEQHHGRHTGTLPGR
jgi:RNA polymerase sigma-70 factor (ECF subfamily)